MADFDSKEFEPMGVIFHVPSRKRRPKGPVGGKKPSDGGGRGLSRVARVVRKSPEVMFRVTGRTRGFTHMQKHLDYITRNGEVAGVGPEGTIVYGRDTVRDLARTWWAQRAVVPGSRRRNSVETVNFIISMPKGTDRDGVDRAAEKFAAKAFGGRFDYLIADHRDTDHAHVHLTVRARGHNGERFNPKKEDLAMWREWIAHEMREQGIDAEATPRRARGVVKKTKNQAVYHLEQRDGSRVQRAKVMDAVRQASTSAQQGRAEEPWERATKAKQAEIRKAWIDMADHFQTQGVEGRRFAQEIRAFVADMPPVETERDAIRNVVNDRLKGRDKDRGTER